MSQRVRVRRLTDEEGRQLQRIVRRGGGKTQVSVVRYRRAMVVLASAGGNTVEVTFQRTKTWKQSNDPLKEAKLDRIEEVLTKYPDRVFAFDEFGPLAIHPSAAAAGRPSKSRSG